MIEFRKVKKKSKKDCSLYFFNSIRSFIKRPERVFYLSSNKMCIRGNHAHKICNQFFLPINDSIKIEIDNGNIKKKLILKPDKIYKIKPLIWVKVFLKKRQSVLVFCDKKYSAKEYIKNYKKFKKLTSFTS